MIDADASLLRENEAAATGRTDEWHRLRALLLAQEQASLGELSARVGDSERLAHSVAAVLPEALAIRGRQDDRITQTISPIVEGALLHTVKKDPQPLVDALYPIMGPAIRRSIAEALADMLQAFNRAVELSLSPRAIKWRFDAWRTGQSYASVVLLNTLVYRVEQVFLIHRGSGLLLGHAQAERAVVQDPDMVSGMLIAIRDFVGDSFQVDHNHGVDSIRLGDLTVQVQVGPSAVLAAVVRGSVPETLRVQLTETLEGIHKTHLAALNRFKGDATPFTDVRSMLQNCLWTQLRPIKTRRPRVVSALFLAIVALLVWSAVAHYRAATAWDSLVAALAREPGFVVVNAGSSSDHRIVGLRDPLARDPRDVVGTELARDGKIDWLWRPYMSLDPAMVLMRARSVLRPPPSIDLSFDGNALRISGIANPAWLEQARIRAEVLPGVRSVEFSERGSAGQAKLLEIRDTLNAMALYFEPGSDVLSAAQLAKLEVLRLRIEDLRRHADALHLVYRIDIVGRADTPGTTLFNQRLSESRAEAVRQVIVEDGIPTQNVRTFGLGAAEPGAELARDHGVAQSTDRRVNLNVILGSYDPQHDTSR